MTEFWINTFILMFFFLLWYLKVFFHLLTFIKCFVKHPYFFLCYELLFHCRVYIFLSYFYIQYHNACTAILLKNKTLVRLFAVSYHTRTLKRSLIFDSLKSSMLSSTIHLSDGEQHVKINEDFIFCVAFFLFIGTHSAQHSYKWSNNKTLIWGNRNQDLRKKKCAFGHVEGSPFL